MFVYILLGQACERLDTVY